MTQRDRLLRETQDLPDLVLEEILDFVAFVKSKAASQRLETAIASEPALAKDWLRPEEDEAWKNL